MENISYIRNYVQSSIIIFSIFFLITIFQDTFLGCDLNIGFFSKIIAQERALVIVPVIDLVGDYISEENKKLSKFNSYDNFPLQSCKGTSFCKRINQAIFNETIEILQEKGDQVQVKTLNTFFLSPIKSDLTNTDSKSYAQKSTYWAKKENLLFYKEFKKYGSPEEFEDIAIPKAISYSEKNIIQANKNVVTLKSPFHDNITGLTFSAGTRFVKANNRDIAKTGDISQNKDLEKYEEVFIINPKFFDTAKKQEPNMSKNKQELTGKKEKELACKQELTGKQEKELNSKQELTNNKALENNKNILKILIPKELCAKNSDNQESQDKRQEFLEIVKNWANIKDGFIPYVWGGCSFIQICKNEKITKEQELPVFTRPEFNYNPLPGLDCSGLVARAAQICNIPYYYKNTFTAKNYLNKIEHLQNLQNGDLIIYNGHIVIISDIKNNKIIEARTNEYGAGKVQEICLDKIFANTKTFEDLFKAKNSGIKIERIDTKGQTSEIISGLDFYCLI